MALSLLFVVGLSFLLYCGYYFRNYGKKPMVHKKETSQFSIFLDNHVRSLAKPFWSLFFAPGGRMQSILFAILPRNFRVQYHKKEHIPTPDGGSFLLAWASPTNQDERDRPLVVIFSGLVGRTTTGTVQIMARELLKLGYCAVFVGHRGVEIPLQTTKTFCGSDTNDVTLALDIIRARFPSRLIVGVGISFGGLLLCRYLAEQAENSKLHAAFLYGCPFNPVTASVHVENYWLENVYITYCLKQTYNASRELLDSIVDFRKLKRFCSIREFDTHVTAKVFGYESVDHYYRDCVITTKFLHSIKTPTLCLCADDDAFVPSKSLPYEEIARTDYVAMAITHGGGHAGHLQGMSPWTTPYVVDVMTNYVSAVFRHVDELPTPKAFDSHFLG